MYKILNQLPFVSPAKSLKWLDRFVLFFVLSASEKKDKSTGTVEKSNKYKLVILYGNCHFGLLSIDGVRGLTDAPWITSFRAIVRNLYHLKYLFS